MPIEAATYISTLAPANPPSTDAVSEGDDHIRLLKSVLQASFPNITGAMTATQAILNGIDARATALETSVALIDNGASVVPVSGVLEQAQPIVASVALNYTYLLTDRAKIVTRTNAAAMGDTLPQATGTFGAGWFMFVKNIHASNLLTITPTTSLIDGAASIIVYPGQTLMVTSDGTNYVVVVIHSGVWRYQAKTAAYVFLPTESRPATIIDYTTAGFTLSTAVAASNFTGQLLIVRNSAATLDVTFDPNGGETVDGASTLVIHPGQTYFLTSDGTNWKSLADNVLQKSSAIASKAAAYTAAVADQGKSIRFAGLSADVTLTLLPAATAGNGFLLYISNEDTAYWKVTVDPNGAELIDGFANRIMSQGTRITLLCDGTGWRTVSGKWRTISDNYTLTASTLTTYAHGLGVTPDKITFILECLAVSAGYAIGNTLIVGANLQSIGSGSAMYGFITQADATNVYLRCTATNFGTLIGKTSFLQVSVAYGDWAVRIVAEE